MITTITKPLSIGRARRMATAGRVRIGLSMIYCTMVRILFVAVKLSGSFNRLCLRGFDISPLLALFYDAILQGRQKSIILGTTPSGPHKQYSHESFARYS